MGTIKLPDGYNGHFVECECEPIEKDGETYKLRVKGSSYLIKWCSREQWLAAILEENKYLKLQVIDLVSLLKKSIKQREEVKNVIN